MKIVIIDGQGGGIGRALVAQLSKAVPDAEILALGTNSLATASMLKAGASVAATGENAIVVNCQDANVIAGPMGIITADSMYGEITKQMAMAVASSKAKKILIPIERCSVLVAGIVEAPLGRYIEQAVELIVSCGKKE